MGSRKSIKQPPLEFSGVRVVDISNVPPKYFMGDDVRSLLEKIISDDVKSNNLPIPSGCEPVHREVLKTRVSNKIQNVRKHSVILDLLPDFVIILFLILLFGFLFLPLIRIIWNA